MAEQDVYQPEGVIQPAPPPTQSAQDVENSAINTRTRKIFQLFQLLSSGGLQDKDGNTILDQDGLDQSNFPSRGFNIPDDVVTTSAPYVDIPNCSTTLTLTKASTVIFLYSATLSNENALNGEYAVVGLNVDGEDDFDGAPFLLGSGVPYQDGGGVFVDVTPQYVSAFFIDTVAAGTHTVKLRMGSGGVSGGFNAHAANVYLSCLVLGA
jgi:hypothetical protein